MNYVLRTLASIVARRPGLALVGLLLVTVVFAGLAGSLTSETDLTSFSPSTERAVALDDIGETFGGQGEVVQIILEAPEGNILTAEGTAFAQQVAETVRTAAGEYLVGEVNSFANRDTGGALLSQDYDATSETATAGLVVAALDPSLEPLDAQDVAVGIQQAVEALDTPAGIEVIPFSQGILNASLSEGMGADLPRLLGISLLLVLAILAYTYRSVTDLVLGFVGLIVTIVWTYGLAALLGPSYLGITGPLSQISTIVPVLLVGLGIDYAIHLTGRYREQQRRGASARGAASTAVMTVGGALVLATATTVVGFLTNVASPLPPITDFGIFTAAGVISAFIVFLVLIPSARHVLDRRKEDPATAELPDATELELGSGDAVGLSRLMQRASAVSKHFPVPVIGVAVLVTVAAVVAATQVATTFSQDDFIPEGSLADRAITALEDYFGGDLSERTYILVRGDASDPAVANAILDAEEALGQSELVRTGQDGQPDVSSPPSVAVEVLGEDAAVYGWDGSRFAPDADLDGLYAAARDAAPAAMSGTLKDGLALISAATTAGQDGADLVDHDFKPAADSIDETGAEAIATSQVIVIDEILSALQASQVRGIVITLVASAILLVSYYWYVGRQPLLGLITMTPSTLVTAWIIGSMWALGLSFNVLTAMVASLAIGIGVPYGIHITHRFRHEWDGTGDAGKVDAALGEVVTHTGGALLGSAATTVAGFGTLAFSSLAPIQQFGTITALAIAYALIAATFVQPALLKLWAERRGR
ncbi:MAG: MMPL family transporter [Dehalococcoidia bacterium]|nr:MMPL family transporter [Dehalococcoidia bacterium]